MTWELRPLTPDVVELLAGYVPAAAALIGDALAHAWAAFWYEQLVCVGGIQPMHPGVGNCWIVPVPGRLSRRPLKRAIATMRQTMRLALLHGDYWRLQAAVRCDFDPAIKLAISLGGICEGRMAQYGPDGADYWLFAWVRKLE